MSYRNVQSDGNCGSKIHKAAAVVATAATVTEKVEEENDEKNVRN